VPIAEIAILQCPDCGWILNAMDIRESGEPFLAVTTCKHCGAKVQIRDEPGKKYAVIGKPNPS
jgi:predicted RNA-binding Zn-ribbon protein involved in translation (DUF1610 family)